jgi:hypothetical protein
MPRLSTILRVAAVLVLAGAVASARAGGVQAAGASGQPSRQSAETAGTALLAGRAVDAVTGAPVANTLLGLSRRRAAGPNTTPVAANVPLVLVMADADGRFVVRDIPRGSYLLLATAPGYIVSNYGQGRAAGPTRTIDLGDGETRADLTIPLWRHAVISGTVTDEAGEPVVGATVRVLRRVANGPGGVERYGPGHQTTTDDLGQYRLTTLPPGAYVVGVPQTQVTVPVSVVDAYVQSAAAQGGNEAGGRLLDLMNSSSAVPSAGGGVRVEDLLLQSSGGGRALAIPPPGAAGLAVYPTTFHPSGDGVPPTVVTLEPGEERAGVEIVLRPERAVRVSGTVTADGRPAPDVAVRLVPAGGPAMANQNGFESAATITAPDGSFTLLGVTPGRYVLKALKTPRLRLPPALASNPAIVAAYDSDAAGAASNLQPVGEQLSLTIGTADVSDLDVTLRTGATVRGRVAFAGGPPPPVPDLRRIAILLGSEDGGLPGANLQIVGIGEDGTFEMTAPAPGRYMVTGLRVPLRWRLSDLAVAGRPLTGPIDLGAGDVADLVLTYTDRLAGIAGTVRMPGGPNNASAGVVVFPTDRRFWMMDPLNPREPRIEQAMNDGTFLVADLLPGEYFVAAVDDADMPEFADPDFFEAATGFAVRVTLSAEQTLSRDLAVTRIIR